MVHALQSPGMQLDGLSVFTKVTQMQMMCGISSTYTQSKISALLYMETLHRSCVCRVWVPGCPTVISARCCTNCTWGIGDIGMGAHTPYTCNELHSGWWSFWVLHPRNYYFALIDTKVKEQFHFFQPKSRIGQALQPHISLIKKKKLKNWKRTSYLQQTSFWNILHKNKSETYLYR